MDTDLTIQLFFFGLAVPVALEAYKERERKVARIVLWSVVVTFGFMGFVWPSLNEGIPKISNALSTLVVNPVTWFVLFVGMYFVTRPFWKLNVDNDNGRSIPDQLSDPYDDTFLLSEIEALKNTNVYDAEKDVRALGLRITTAQDAIAEMLPRLDSMDKRFEAIEKENVEKFSALSDGCALTNEWIVEMIGLTSLKFEGTQLLMEITPQATQSDEWDRLSNRREHFIQKIFSLRFNFDREGLHYVYFIKQTAPDEGDLGEEKLSEYRINYHYVRGALKRLQQSEQELLSEILDAK